MAYGFKVITGINGQIQQVSTEDTPGIFLDQFWVAYGTTEYRNYSGVQGVGEIFPQCTYAGNQGSVGSTTVTISGLQLWVQCGGAGSVWGTASLYVVVMGK